MESRFSFLADALSGRHDNMDVSCLAGNPDIRVPETVKTDDGLRAARVVAERDTGGEKEEEKGRPEETGGRPTTEEPRESAEQNLAETGEVPERRELRHVPRGTWLDQDRNTWGGNPRHYIMDRSVYDTCLGNQAVAALYAALQVAEAKIQMWSEPRWDACLRRDLTYKHWKMALNLCVPQCQTEIYQIQLPTPYIPHATPSEKDVTWGCPSVSKKQAS
ncbi:hypothetical protein NDU88_006485 [Pleurodeles waltl]|uniref:Uncharacterized protein n=1 Tax=Pleurodeles waltl TaxID=8319 RepID=A0AAV7WXQ4_PLEWA|nr:hypothetical protein NDU88_006485 [Pleurodeles waltl]